MPKEENKKEEEVNEDEGEKEEQMDGDMDDGEQDQEVEQDDAEGEEDAVPVYVEKDLVARVPYESESKEETLREVNESKVVNTRRPLKVRISRRRGDFHSDSYNLIDREAGENAQDLKPKKSGPQQKRKMVLDIGLQAARPMKTF